MILKLSKSIITQARKQAAEIEEEFGAPAAAKVKAVSLGTAEASDEDSEDDLEIQKYDEKEIDVNEDDDLAIRMFMKPSGVKTKTLADLINEKITEKKTEIDTQFTD